MPNVKCLRVCIMGLKLDWQDLCYLDKDELLEVCEENPKGIAQYIQDMILGGKYD